MMFEQGQVCGGSYLIERPFAHSPVTETYLARDILTGQEVLLTCSKLEDSSKRLRASFLSNVAKLRAIKAENSPRILAGDVTDRGVWWVVREHFADAVPLLDFITSETLESAFLARLRLGLVRGDVTSYLFLILTAVVKTAKTLRRFAVHGFYHGGLDSTTTIALRGDGTLIVFDAGYRELFGASYFDASEHVAHFRAPESSAHRTGDARGDIYALGFILQGVLGLGIAIHGMKPLTALLAQLEPLTRPNPSKRPQNWDEIISTFEPPYDELLTKVVHRAKTDDDASNATPQADDPIPESGAPAVGVNNGTDPDPSPAPVAVGVVAHQAKTEPAAPNAAPTADNLAPERDARAIFAADGPDTDRSPVSLAIECEIEVPTPRVPEVPAPVSVEGDADELVAVAPAGGSDEAEPTAADVGVSIAASEPTALAAASARGSVPIVVDFEPVEPSAPVVVDDAPVTVRVVAPLAASVVLPAVPAVRNVKVPQIAPVADPALASVAPALRDVKALPLRVRGWKGAKSGRASTVWVALAAGIGFAIMVLSLGFLWSTAKALHDIAPKTKSVVDPLRSIYVEDHGRMMSNN